MGFERYQVLEVRNGQITRGHPDSIVVNTGRIEGIFEIHMAVWPVTMGGSYPGAPDKKPTPTPTPVAEKKTPRPLVKAENG
jgi:hypothetical protein